MNVLMKLIIVALMVHATTLLEDLTVCVTKDTLEVEFTALVKLCNTYFMYLLYILSDINECANATTCDSNANCTNTPGSFTCTCNHGYTGNGTTNCEGKNSIGTLLFTITYNHTQRRAQGLTILRAKRNASGTLFH